MHMADEEATSANAKVDEIDTGHGRKISFWQGQPANIGFDDPVDMIIVSAFHDNYTPTKWSIIGHLYRKGLSVAELAKNKAVDLRDTAGFWLSQPLPQPPPTLAAVGTRRILCFEPHTLGARPAEVVGSLFRGLFPFLSDQHEARVAMAVISTGAMREDPERMLRALVTAAREWMSRGLPIRELMIMEQNASRVRALAPVFADLKNQPKHEALVAAPNQVYDVFLSFSSKDETLVGVLKDELARCSPQLRVYDFRMTIDPGKEWQDELDGVLQSCRKAVALLTPSYFQSAECREELGIARLRNKRQNYTFFVPLYVRSCTNEQEFPLWIAAINYIDCREADNAKLIAAAAKVAKLSV
jgi:hypothetical protein